MKTTRLYRPIGVGEYKLIKKVDYLEFPPRLSWQPIFYPVLNQAYAEQIALDWNTKDEFSGYCGLVTAFDVDAEYLEKFKVENVGAKMHNELWVPSEELANFNAHIQGRITIVNAFFGIEFSIDEQNCLMEYYQQYK